MMVHQSYNINTRSPLVMLMSMLGLLMNRSSVSSFSASPSNDFTGKVVAQRYLYRLNPDQSSIFIPREYTIEERQYYIVEEDRSLSPLGDKCFYIRGQKGGNDNGDEGGECSEVLPPQDLKKNGQPRIYTKIGGNALYKVKNVAEVNEDDDQYENDDGGLGATIWDSSHVMTLYCMANPHLIKGNVLELGTGVGIGGLLSTIGAGISMAQSDDASADASASADADGVTAPKYQSIEDIANSPAPQPDQQQHDDDNDDAILHTKKTAPVPPLLKRLSLTDTNIPTLNKCLTNVQKSSFPSSKIDVSQLDWSTRTPADQRASFDCILGCDCAYYYPIIKPLARTVAYRLQISPYDRVDNLQRLGGTFLHVGPAHRESIHDLKVKLSRGYRMNTRSESIMLERYDLVPLVLESLAREEEQMEEEAEGMYVECQNVERTMFESTVAYHNEDYDGFNGETFFPVETGTEDGMERDVGYGTSSDKGGSSGEGRGPWLG